MFYFNVGCWNQVYDEDISCQPSVVRVNLGGNQCRWNWVFWYNSLNICLVNGGDKKCWLVGLVKYLLSWCPPQPISFVLLWPDNQNLNACNFTRSRPLRPAQPEMAASEKRERKRYLRWFLKLVTVKRSEWVRDGETVTSCFPCCCLLAYLPVVLLLE